MHNIQLEESLLKPMQLPDDPTKAWVSFFAPNQNSVYKIAEKRQKMAELGEDEELVDDQVRVFFGDPVYKTGIRVSVCARL